MFYRLLTDIFDMGSELYQMRMKAAVTSPMPDLSKVEYGHLVTPQEKADSELFYVPVEETPDIKFKPVIKLPFIEIHDGSFRSPMVTPFEENNTVYVTHFRLPQNGLGGPTVVMIHGWKMDDYTYFDWWCWRFAAWGLNSILVNMPYHIKRTPKGTFSGQLLLTDDTMWNLATLKQSYVDVHCVVNWLRANGAGPIGTFGVSYGGFMAGLYVCRARNADFAIMGMPPMDTIEVLKSTEIGEIWMKREAEGKMSMLTDPDVPKIYNLNETRPLAPLSNIFIAMGIYDKLVDPDSIRDTAREWGGLPWLREYPTGHINTFALNLAFINDAHKFIQKEVL